MNDVVRTNTLFSIIWSILSKWSSKLIGMVSTIVLARLLTPADFGIIAMATIVVALLESMTQAGLNLYILRYKEHDERVFNTAWTVGIIQAFCVAIPLLIAAPWIADFYAQPVLTEVIYCLALVRIIQGLNNFGVFIAQKQMNFKVDFVLTLYTRLIYLASTIFFAWYLQSFWALVFGQLISSVAGCLISYWVHPYRPKLSLYNWRDLLKYSKSTVPLSIGRYINNQADVAVVGRVASAEFLGLYHIAVNLAGLFTKELLMPVIRGLIPNLSVLRESANFKAILLTTFAAAVYVFLPVGVGLSLVAPEFVAVLLGDKWLSVTPMLAWFSLYAMIGGMMMFFSEQFLVMMERESLSNGLMWFRNLVLLSTIAITLIYFDVKDLPQALFWSVLAVLPVILISISRALELSLFKILHSWWPALLSAALMALSIYYFPALSWPLFIMLILKVVCGALVYALSLILLYIVRGRPTDSLEGAVFDKIPGAGMLRKSQP
ncbi:oligosaccharide flippase family protein [Aliiglaciecola sp. LCG003]|uniref:oligosaccharide flippase family protein n=1 Tax=Aliiglaciecola sp. LCG003 TaxID=3053655 RepID=UPI002573D62D|nr:oligosaccharide flippase family protein [Aliiglaciecola sp. LCG003]WJG10455.1 oligosaccharide flippase family protein [Aliiglaciecola sp. LCG003]